MRPCFLLSALLYGVLFAGCSSKSNDKLSPEGTQRLQVVCTTGQIGDAVRNVVGELADVSVLMGPGIDPHLYRDRPADLRKLSQADVVFFNGLHFEGIHDTLERLGEKQPVFAVSAKLEASKDPRLIYPGGFKSLPDPHIFHSASIWADCVEAIGERMAEVDVDHAEQYRQNAKRHADELRQLHNEVAQQIASIPENKRLLVTAHDAFGYFSAAYGIETVGLKGVSTEDEIDLAHMESVVNTVVQREVPAVFVESSVAPRIVEALAEPAQGQGHTVRVVGTDVGERQLYADALGDADSGADTYIGMMQVNVRTIVEALGGEFRPHVAPSDTSAETGAQ